MQNDGDASIGNVMKSDVYVGDKRKDLEDDFDVSLTDEEADRKVSKKKRIIVEDESVTDSSVDSDSSVGSDTSGLKMALIPAVGKGG